MDPQDFDTMVGNMSTAAQARASKPLDVSVGSVALALFEAIAGVGLWIQGLVVQLQKYARASLATGADLDSWMADFALVGRNPATSSVVTLRFARFTSTTAALVPVGTIAQTQDGTVQFSVVAAPSNAAWNGAQNGYSIPAGTAYVDVPAQAVTAGAFGNVAAGAVNTIVTPIPYVSTVTNLAAATGGTDDESDDSFRARFVAEINSLSKSTPDAIAGAVAGYGSGISYKLLENQDITGAPAPGFFYVYVDDGTGATSASTLNGIAAAIEAVRGFTVGFSVIAASPLQAAVAITVAAVPGYDAASLQSAVQSAVTSYIQSLGVGAPLYFTQLGAVVWAVAGVANVVGITLNGGTSNLVPTAAQVVTAGTVAVSIA